jgi:hypothetical protein
MIDQLTELTNKTNELEKTIQSLSERQKIDENQANCLSFSRNFSSLEIILSKKILVTKIEPQKNQNLLLQCQLDLTLSADECVEISFIVNNFVIYKTYKILSQGSSQISLMQNYKPLTDDKISVYVEIAPVSQKPIVLNHIALFVWGNLKNNNYTDYQAISVQNSYLLSMLDNNCVYFLTTDKEIGEYNLVDLDYVDTAISHCFLYDNANNILYFFRVDLNGNLFYSNYTSGDEIFLASGVLNVSADISSNGKILVSYIKNNECYYFELNVLNGSSIHKKLYINNNNFSRVLCYFNSYRNKFMLLLSTPNNNNYIIEQIDEDFSNSDTVTAEYGFYITTENVSE